MADGGKSPDIQQSIKTEPIKRRGFLRMAVGVLGAGAAVVTGLGRARTAEAQSLFPPATDPKPPDPTNENSNSIIDITQGGLVPDVKPSSKPQSTKNENVVNPEIPDSFQTPIRKLTKVAGSLLAEKEEIDVQFKQGESGSVAYTQHPITEEQDKKQTIKGYKSRKMYVNYSAGEEEATTQKAAKILGKFVNDSFLGNPADQFSLDFSKHSGIDINKIATGEVKLKDVPNLGYVLTYFDLANYSNGKKKEDIYEDPKALKTVLFENTFSIWMTSSEKLANRIEKSPPNEKTMIANVFLAGLKRILDCAGVGMGFDDLGVDKKNIDKVLALSDNQIYKKYIEEKTDSMNKNSQKTLPKAA